MCYSNHVPLLILFTDGVISPLTVSSELSASSSSDSRHDTSISTRADDDSDHNEDLLMNLNKFRLMIAKQVVDHFPDTYGLYKRVLGKNSMLFLSSNKPTRKKMVDIRADAALENFIVDVAKDKNPKKKQLTELQLLVAFGKSHEGDHITDMAFFGDGNTLPSYNPVSDSICYLIVSSIAY